MPQGDGATGDDCDWQTLPFLASLATSARRCKRWPTRKRS
jgi:hypothetical protein